MQKCQLKIGSKSAIASNTFAKYQVCVAVPCNFTIWCCQKYENENKSTTLSCYDRQASKVLSHFCYVGLLRAKKGMKNDWSGNGKEKKTRFRFTRYSFSHTN